MIFLKIDRFFSLRSRAHVSLSAHEPERLDLRKLQDWGWELILEPDDNELNGRYLVQKKDDDLRGKQHWQQLLRYNLEAIRSGL
jgi:hypothetical protein